MSAVLTNLARTLFVVVCGLAVGLVESAAIPDEFLIKCTSFGRPCDRRQEFCLEGTPQCVRCSIECSPDAMKHIGRAERCNQICEVYLASLPKTTVVQDVTTVVQDVTSVVQDVTTVEAVKEELHQHGKTDENTQTSGTTPWTIPIVAVLATALSVVLLVAFVIYRRNNARSINESGASSVVSLTPPMRPTAITDGDIAANGPPQQGSANTPLLRSPEGETPTAFLDDPNTSGVVAHPSSPTRSISSPFTDPAMMPIQESSLNT